MKWTGLGLYWPSHKVGLSPAARAGLMFQPGAKRGWTQPSRAGWADVPAHWRREETHVAGHCAHAQ
jgi:hypothetical protein